MAKTPSETDHLKQQALAQLRGPLRRTWLGLVTERLAQAFWPLISLVLLGLGSLMFDILSWLSTDAALVLLGIFGVAILASLGFGIRALAWPTRAEAFDRLDRSLDGRPLSALGDNQAIGEQDLASNRVWQTHLSRMADRAKGAKPVPATVRLSGRDRYALRLVAATFFVMALVFGSVWRIADAPKDLRAGQTGGSATGAVWEGWVEPPGYTGLPSIYLADVDTPSLSLTVGSKVSLRFYGPLGAYTVGQSFASTPSSSPSEAAHVFEVAQSGDLTLDGPDGRTISITAIPDLPPTINTNGEMEAISQGRMRLGFVARDDYAVTGGSAVISLNMASVDRRHGLALAPEERGDLVLDLPVPFTSDSKEFAEIIEEDLSKHPWANLPVTVELRALDILDQVGTSAPLEAILPGRSFFDPLAKSVIELRRDLLWNRENAPRIARMLRAVTHRPEEIIRDSGAYLQIRAVIRSLESDDLAMTDDTQSDLSEAMWAIALKLEYGGLADAKAALERAQDRLSEAMKNGATDEEIAALIEELRRAMDAYMRQLAQQGPQDQQQQAQNQSPSAQMDQQDLADLLDRIQELMEQGRMEEAAELLEQLREMTENMQVTQGQQGEGEQSPGEQAMQDLNDTLRQQQGLTDEAFRDLQEQFNRDAQAGENQGNTGRSGGQGRGAEHQGGQQGEGQGQGQQGQQNGQGGNQQPTPGEGEQSGGEGQGSNQGQSGDQSGNQSGTGDLSGESGGDQQSLEQSLAQRQQGLRQNLDQLRGNLPGAGTEEGDRAREALGRAAEAMDRAADDLRNDDLAGAIDNQADAIEAMREGMRAISEALAEENGNQGDQPGNPNQQGQNQDPLGRGEGNSGQAGTDQEMMQGEDVYQRARELLDEIRRRQGERTRPQQELEYLKRLLDRF